MVLSEILISLGVVVAILLVAILAPTAYFFSNLLASLFFYLYKKTHQNNPYLVNSPRKFWEWPVTVLMKIWRFHGWLCHGYEIIGLENIPDDEGVILASYHAVGPVDAMYVLSNIYLAKNRKVLAIVHKLSTEIPGYQSFIEALEHQTGTLESCVEMMNKGELLLIYPGSIKESILSEQDYKIIWPEKAGFGKVTHAAKNKIVPLFTKNSQEISMYLRCLGGYFNRKYEENKVGWKPIVGWFPVKLKTYIGKPIEYGPDASIEEIVKLTKDSLERLINEHQKIPGSIPRALLERFTG